MADTFIGKKLDGRYEILELIGEGGMSNVYKGHDLREDKPVAVKILKEEFHGNEELVRRFKNEGRAISVLNQPNIVKVFDVSVNDKLHYIVMEHIDGITLKEYIEQRGEPLTYKESIMFISQILLALQHAHDKGIVHRDIKPQNIMLTEDGSVKVMDFGIARLARNEVHTEGEQAIGSVHYISPEQAQGATTDHRADIYSAGITLYEMLSGKLPFESDDAVAIAIKQISDEATPLCVLNPSVPEGLGSITMKAMAKDPKDRYQTALEMLRDIEEFKKNPSVKFEYDYMEGADPARYMNKVAANSKPQTKGKTNSKAAPKKKKKKKRGFFVPIVAGITVAVVAVCGILCYNIFQQSGNPLFVDLQEIELPRLEGMTETAARDLLSQGEYQHLRIMDVQYEYNEDLEAGIIISQNPSSGMRVKENQRIYLVVNRGIELVPVPDVAGMSRSEARQSLLDIGVRPYIVSQVNESVPVGQVFATDPPIGSLVENTTSTVVTVYISSNATNWLRTVPNLVGLESAAVAQLVLEQNELNLGMVQEEYSDQPPGTVIDQYPEAGVSRSKASSVYITVSAGGEPEPEPEVEYVDVPNVVGGTLGSASADGVSFVEGGREYSDAPEGTIIGQSTSGQAPRGTVVYVTISNGPAPDASTSIPNEGENPPPPGEGENPAGENPENPGDEQPPAEEGGDDRASREE